MSTLNVTLIDVGWGDSIFIQSVDSQGKSYYALIDSNDTTYNRSSYIFLKKFFERVKISFQNGIPVFDFVLLTHAHSDHGQGLKQIMKEFGTNYFYYPKSLEWSALSTLLDFANKSTNVKHHESLNSTKILPNFGDVSLQVLWPNYADPPNSNENNNSIVLHLRLADVSFLLTGDAESDVWSKIKTKIPADLKVFKVPHHGSINGAFDINQTPCWLNDIPSDTLLGISSHVMPFGHPHQKVIDLFESNHFKFFRTDTDYHLTFTSDGTDIKTKYSHFA